MFDLIPSSRRHDDLFDPFWQWDVWNRSLFPHTERSFRTDIRDENGQYVLEADLPGLEKEDIDVQVQNHNLVISVSRQQEQESKDEQGNYLHRERTWGSCSRSFSLADVKEEAISASYHNGVLTLILPKKEKPASSVRHLEIQ